MSDPITDNEYRQRYIARLAMLLETKGMQPADEARELAEEGYEVCPRGDMDDRWINDPEGCAEESYVEWRDNGREVFYDY
jgi:hypothetical protein